MGRGRTFVRFNNGYVCETTESLIDIDNFISPVSKYLAQPNEIEDSKEFLERICQQVRCFNSLRVFEGINGSGVENIGRKIVIQKKRLGELPKIDGVEYRVDKDGNIQARYHGRKLEF